MSHLSINHRQIELVQRSFTQVAPHAVSCSAAFYRRLFELDPSLKALFKNDIHVQGVMLMKVLAMAVNSLYDLDSIADDLRILGARHVGYGVQRAHYKIVEKALIMMLQDVQGETFSKELEVAWQQVFRCISRLMRDE
ncbi:globin domain-containing protein [Alteromonas sp. a30]|uniref:globin domain-containing protein n=1 Tax=Alteromonas sp. a30 TaxID=2730917 RepID=UPI0022822E76|nr:globin domain-containing protein [Alteromonas sp. a30]MCY7295556.1 hemin receptor [Alteromonas sp. a30]